MSKKLHTGEKIATNGRELLGQLHGSAAEAEKEKITKLFGVLVETIAAWAHNSEHKIDSIKRLGGGFKNPVVMLTTAKGEQFVAKAFVEEEDLHMTRLAREKLDELFAEDERVIPRSEIFQDTLFSEKAKGEPIKDLIVDALNNPEQMLRAMEAFSVVGATLGMIHERTEQPIHEGDDLSDETAVIVRLDRDKALRHMDELNITSLTGLSSETLQTVKERMGELTKPNFVSLIHSDAHLDQFFHEEGGAVAEIVDYDSIREGDPMVDLGRLVASLRDWCKKFGASNDIEMGLTKAMVRGYETVRQEDGLHPGADELDVMRVVAYELRLHLIKLKGFSDLRLTLSGVGTELALAEHDIIDAVGDQARIIDNILTSEDQDRLNELRLLSSELKDIMEYLPHLKDEKHGRDDQQEQLAA